MKYLISAIHNFQEKIQKFICKLPKRFANCELRIANSNPAAYGIFWLIKKLIYLFNTGHHFLKFFCLTFVRFAKVVEWLLNKELCEIYTIPWGKGSFFSFSYFWWLISAHLMWIHLSQRSHWTDLSSSSTSSEHTLHG